MAILKTYDLKGNKLSFANWISNLSPVDTPFASMIGKESVDQTMYSWQVDRLAAPANPEIQEGAAFAAEVLVPTQVKSNFTQIMRKVVRITDTANKVGLYGRASEKAYQMEKAGRELKRDLEKAMLSQVDMVAGNKTTARKFAGFIGLVAAEGLADADTGAVVHKSHKAAAVDDPAFGKNELFDMTYNLYLAGSKANKIMVHPTHMHLFSALIGANVGGVVRMFDNVDPKFNMFVNKIRDPLGQLFEVIPNRFMPLDKLYFFNEADWTQMVLREPKSEELARNGSSERHMIEMEVGLRHRNPFASGILHLVAHDGTNVAAFSRLTHDNVAKGTATKLEIHLMKDGAPEDPTTATVTGITSVPAAGITIPSTMPTFAAGKATTNDISTQAAGTYVITASLSNGLKVASELVVHSEDLRVATLDEVQEEVVVEAPKARKARAKAE